VEGYDASTYGERWADAYDDWYEDPAEVSVVVEALAALAGPTDAPGALLELGIGTGLLALPLAARGYDVRGIDASPAMVAKLRAKPGGDRIPVHIGDMAEVVVPGTPVACRGAFVANNTFFALDTEAAQRRCLRGVRTALADGGWLVLAAFIPADRVLDEPSSNVGVRSMGADHLVLTADRSDPVAQTISGQFVDISAEGIRLRPFHLRWALPAQLDAMALDTGLALDQRWSSWGGAAFDDGAAMHVSVYRAT
jgi:SAM-dependent methyltransferase